MTDGMLLTTGIPSSLPFQFSLDVWCSWPGRLLLHAAGTTAGRPKELKRPLISMYNHDPRIFRTRSAGLTTLILTLETIKPGREFEISKRINELRVLVFVYLSLPAFLVRSLNLQCIDQLESKSFLTSVTLFITRLRKMSKSDCGRVGTGSFRGGGGAGYFSVA